MNVLDEKLQTLNSYQVADGSLHREPSELEILQLESMLGGKLPEDYKEVLFKYGMTGFYNEDGYVTAHLQEPAPDGDVQIVSGLEGFATDADRSIESIARDLRGRMPEHFLPIGHDPGGNYYCLSVGSEDYGGVFFWIHDRPDIDSERLDGMYADLEASGCDTKRMDVHDAIREWEKRHAEELGHRAGYGGTYRAANSFRDFVLSLAVEPLE